jgi:hypothetical protein
MNENEIYSDRGTYAQHCAWLDGLSDDELMICHMPCGYRAEMVYISCLKTTLATCEMTVAARVDFLESLNSFCSECLTAEAVSAVRPACGTAMKMVQEAVKLSRGESLRIIGGFDMFLEFAKLNPSLTEAIKLCNRNGSRPARAA